MFVAKKSGPGYVYVNPADQADQLGASAPAVPTFAAAPLSPNSDQASLTSPTARRGGVSAHSQVPSSRITASLGAPLATSPEELNHYPVAHQIFTAQLFEEERQLRSSAEDSDSQSRPLSPPPPPLQGFSRLTLSTDDVTILPLPFDPHPPPILASSPTLPPSLAMRSFAASADAVRMPGSVAGAAAIATSPLPAESFNTNRFASWPAPAQQHTGAARPDQHSEQVGGSVNSVHACFIVLDSDLCLQPKFRLASFGEPSTSSSASRAPLPAAADGYAASDTLPLLGALPYPTTTAAAIIASNAADSYSFVPGGMRCIYSSNISHCILLFEVWLFACDSYSFVRGGMWCSCYRAFRKGILLFHFFYTFVNTPLY